MNLHAEIGCSQEDHLPNCSHFGEAGTYLSNHSARCEKQTGGGRKNPCICNPKARGIIQDREAARIFEELLRAWSECETESSYNRKKMGDAFLKAKLVLVQKGP